LVARARECDKLQISMSSRIRRLALCGALVVCAGACTAPPRASEREVEPEPPPPPPRPEPPEPPEPPPAKPRPPAPDELGDYVIVEGGELDGHAIPTLSFKQTEVTVAEYRACYGRGACTRPDTGDWCNWSRFRGEREQHPINCVSWNQARDYCAWVGGRVPSEAEWMWAAQGREAARPYPWGRAKPSCARAVMAERESGCGTGATWPVASKPRGVSRDGLHDMAGNVFEWTSTVEHGGCGDTAVVKGGSTFVRNPRYLRVDFGISSGLESQGFGDGVRCVRAVRG
jgi:formylglycine-generating enzyme required for sulfatase activity